MQNFHSFNLSAPLAPALTDGLSSRDLLTTIFVMGLRELGGRGGHRLVAALQPDPHPAPDSGHSVLASWAPSPDGWKTWSSAKGPPSRCSPSGCSSS